MKKWSSLVLLSFLLFSQFQIGTLYANSVTELSTEKQKQIEVLETVEQVIDATIEKIDAKTDNHTIETRLAQKEAEVEEYLAEVK